MIRLLGPRPVGDVQPLDSIPLVPVGHFGVLGGEAFLEGVGDGNGASSREDVLVVSPREDANGEEHVQREELLLGVRISPRGVLEDGGQGILGEAEVVEIVLGRVREGLGAVQPLLGLLRRGPHPRHLLRRGADDGRLRGDEANDGAAGRVRLARRRRRRRPRD